MGKPKQQQQQQRGKGGAAHKGAKQQRRDSRAKPSAGRGAPQRRKAASEVRSRNCLPSRVFALAPRIHSPTFSPVAQYAAHDVFEAEEEEEMSLGEMNKFKDVETYEYKLPENGEGLDEEIDSDEVRSSLHLCRNPCEVSLTLVVLFFSPHSQGV